MFVYQRSLGLRKIGLVLRDLHQLPNQNEDLTKEVSRLLSENSRLREVEHENQLLRQELKIPADEKRFTILASHVINRSALSFLDVAAIDKGSLDGVIVGQAVTLGGALLGRVVAVMAHSADVQLITSSDSIVQSQLQNSRALGIIRGGIHGLVLDYIAQDTTVAAGESVVTSGLGGNLRAGIMIGTVEHTLSQKSDIFQSMSVKPTVRLNQIDIVFVEIAKQ